MRADRNHVSPPVVSMATYRQMHGESLHLRERQDAHDDGVAQGFFLGLVAAVLGWFIVSGHLIRILTFLVRSTLGLEGGA